MVRRHGNLWDKLISDENIELAYKKARKGKSKFYAVQKFEENLSENLKKNQGKFNQ